MPRHTAWPVCLCLVLAGFGPVAAGAEPSADARWMESRLPEIVDLYHFFHSHPELSFREVNTARRLAAELKAIPAEVTTGVGGQGVVAILRNGQGPTVLIRADMDALPIEEETGLPYASKETAEDSDGEKVGVMHACGHDLHMANLVGVGIWLNEHRDRWAGTVVLVGQPAEEMAGGANRMLKAGLYTKFPKPDFALALHVASDMEVGKVGYRSGPALAGSTQVEITVKGKGGHGAMPHKTVDPIVLASTLVLDLQTIVSREIDPVDPAVVSVGSFHGGTSSNIIPDEVHLELTLRAFEPEVRAQLIEAIQRRAKALALGHGAPVPEVDVRGGVPPTINTPALVDRVLPAIAQSIGAGNLVEMDPAMISEDFGYFHEGGVPTFMFRIGTVAPERFAQVKGRSLPALHSPAYYPDPAPSLKTGIQSMGAAVVSLLPPAPGGRPAGGPGQTVTAVTPRQK